jgi:hypothetical protein
LPSGLSIAAIQFLGKAQFAKGSKNAAFLDELCIFPNGRYDDQVDASSGAFARLTRVAHGFTPLTFLYVEPRSRLLHGTPFGDAAAR